MNFLIKILILITLSLTSVYSQESPEKNSDLITDIKTAISNNPNDYGTLYRAAEKFYDNKLFSECRKVANELINLDSTSIQSIQSFRIRASCRYELKDYVGAFEDSLESLRLIPTVQRYGDRDMPNIALSNNYEYKIIFKILVNKLRNDKAVFKYYFQIFDFYESKINDLKEKFPTKIDENGKIKPSDASFAINSLGFKLGIFMDFCAQIYDLHGEAENAEQILRRRVEIHPQWQGLQSRANYYSKKKKYKEAIADLSQIIETVTDIQKFQSEWMTSSSGTPKYYQWLGNIFVQRGDSYVLIGEYENAVADYEEAKLKYSKLQYTITQKPTIEKMENELKEKIKSARLKFKTK